MSDSELRDLERRAAQGERPAEAKLLLERVRRGELGQDQLQLAAYLEHPAARLALEGGELQQPGAGAGRGWVRSLLRRRRDDATELAEWAQGLAPWGQRLVVRGLLAATRLALPIFAARRDDLSPGAALDAVADWCACPCRSCAERAEPLATSALEQAQKLAAEGSAAVPAHHAARAAHHLAVIAFECGTLPKPDAAQRLHFLTPALLAELTGAGLSGDAIRAAVSDELLPLALQLASAPDAVQDPPEA